MSMDTGPVRQRLEDATNALTPPWTYTPGTALIEAGATTWSLTGSEPGGLHAYVTEYRHGHALAELVTHAPTDIAELLDEVQRLNEEIANLRHELHVEEMHAGHRTCGVCEHLEREEAESRLQELMDENDALRAELAKERAGGAS